MQTTLRKQSSPQPVTGAFRLARDSENEFNPFDNEALDSEKRINKEAVKKIILADDDPGIVDVISIMLEMQGYEVSATRHGGAVLEMSNSRPDIIILDIWMSGVDGRDICRTLKAEEKTKDIPIILISASHDIRQSALDAGANDFIEKPFEMSELLGKIKEYL